MANKSIAIANSTASNVSLFSCLKGRRTLPIIAVLLAFPPPHVSSTRGQSSDNVRESDSQIESDSLKGNYLWIACLLWFSIMRAKRTKGKRPCSSWTERAASASTDTQSLLNPRTAQRQRSKAKTQGRSARLRAPHWGAWLGYWEVLWAWHLVQPRDLGPEPQWTCTMPGLAATSSMTLASPCSQGRSRS